MRSVIWLHLFYMIHNRGERFLEDNEVNHYTQKSFFIILNTPYNFRELSLHRTV